MKKTKGFTKCENKLLFSNDLSPISKLVFVGLSYYDRGRGCWAKRETLAKMLNVSIYQLRKALNSLEEQGFILIHKRHNGHTDIIRVVKETASPAVANTATPYTIVEEDINEEELDPKTAEDVVENKKQPSKAEIIPKTPIKRKQIAPNSIKSLPIHQRATETILEGKNPIKPLPIHQESTERLHDHLKGSIRPRSYSSWFEGKTAVSFEDKTSMTIRCINTFIAEWLESNYTALLEGIVGKQVSFHAKESRNGQETNCEGSSSLPKIP